MALLRELIQPAQLERCGDRSFPVLSMTMHDGIMLQSDRFKKSLASVDQSAYKVVRRNQLVVGFPIDEGVLYIQQVVDAGIMSPAYDVWNVDETKVDLRYFELCLHSPQSMMFYKTNLRGTTARRRSLPKETLLSLPVPVPSMERQRIIASAIDCLQALIRLRQHQLCSLDELIKARFVEMFGEPISNDRLLPMVTLADLGSWNSGGTPSRTNPAFFEGDIDWYSAGELNSLYLNGSIERITAEALEKSAAKLFPKGSMLVGMYDTAAFKMGILRKASTSNQACACIEPNEKVNILWLYYCLQIMKPYFMEQRRGIRQKNLNLGMIKSFQIPYGDYEQQCSFAAFVSQVDKSKLSIQSSLDQLETLKQSLMQEYFG